MAGGDYRDDPLNTLLPAPADPHAPIGRGLLRSWQSHDPAFIHDETLRDIEKAARGEVRFITPIPPIPPEVIWADAREQDAREDTSSIPAIAVAELAHDDPETTERIGRIETIWQEWTKPAATAEPVPTVDPVITAKLGWPLPLPLLTTARAG